MAVPAPLPMPRTLGRWDLVLLNIVAIVNINNVPPVAVFGWASLALWLLAFGAFFVPEAIAVLTLGRRYPGEGGIYLWTRKAFGDAHGFLSGWCYWTNNLFYVPVLLVYMAGIFAFAGGEAAAAGLVNQKTVRARRVDRLAGARCRREHPRPGGRQVDSEIGGVGCGREHRAGARGVRRRRGRAVPRRMRRRSPVSAGTWRPASPSCATRMVGIELASTMGDEIRDPARDLGAGDLHRRRRLDCRRICSSPARS